MSQFFTDGKQSKQAYIYNFLANDKNKHKNNESKPSNSNGNYFQ